MAAEREREEEHNAITGAVGAVMKVGVPISLVSRHPVLRREILNAFPGAKFNDNPGVFTEAELIQWLADCDAAIIGLEPITEHVLAALPRLKVIGKFGVGLNNVDIKALQRYGVRFGYQQGVNRRSVAELALCFAIAGLRGIVGANQAMRAGERPRQNLGRLLTGRTVGVHGCGNIGQEFITLLKPFGCVLLACDIQDRSDFFRVHDVRKVDFEELLERSEVLSIHLPLTGATDHLYDERALLRLRRDCVLINTSRGGIVDELILRRRLAAGDLTAACFDVFAVEPATDDELLGLRNFLATPHIGASAEEARLAMGRAAIRGLSENAIPDPEVYLYR